VLDNAKDVDQIRPLLPGDSTSVAVVTSRSDQLGLIALEGASLLRLTVLDDDQAEQLLMARLGTECLVANRVAVDRIVLKCAGLPLALAIVAAHAGTSSEGLTAIGQSLIGDESGLDVLSVPGDITADIRAVFAGSYLDLAPATALLFRRLGLHPGPSFDAFAATCLVDASTEQVLRSLSELVGANLVIRSASNRYELHDLLHSYAAELIQNDDPIDSDDACRRLIEYYLGAADGADNALDPQRDRRIHLVDTTPLRTFGSVDDALAWFKMEHQVLLAVIQMTRRPGLESYAWQLAWTMGTYLDREGRWQDWVDTTAIALEAATALEHAAGQAKAHRMLAHAAVQQGRLNDATVHLEQALSIFHDLGDTSSEAATQNSLGGICDLRGLHEQALAHSERSLRLFEIADDLIGMAHAANSVGWCQARMGQFTLALAACTRSQQLLHELGDTFGEANAWDSLGLIHRGLGDNRRALDCYEQAHALFSDAADRYAQSQVLDHIGDTYRDLEELEKSREAWTRAVDVLKEIDPREADLISAKLFGLPSNT
jgi:tetratricopeptide (TPR) repeat protein